MLEPPRLMETCGLGRERKGKEEEPLIPRWPRSHVATVLYSVTNGESYRWNLETAPTPGDLVYWTHKEMWKKKQNKTTYTIPWLWLSVIAKMKSREYWVWDVDARPSSDFNESELQPLASKPPP